MLKTALKPKWIATLVGCLLAATAFVLLSQWQFGQSSTTTVTSSGKTETAVPLTEHFEPGRDMYVPDADQIVSASGTFVKDSAVLISKRLQNGTNGWWVVAGFLPNGAPDNNLIPVVRGWQAQPTAPAALPAGEVKLTGRLIPSESPTVSSKDENGAYPDLSAAWLQNVWNHDSYDGFIVIFDASSEAGDVGAASAGLEKIWVGPQPEGTTVNWLNIFYGVEWVVFAGFAFFIWWRLVKDDFQRDEEYRLELAAWQDRQAKRESAAASGTPAAPAASGTAHSTPSHPTQNNTKES